MTGNNNGFGGFQQPAQGFAQPQQQPQQGFAQPQQGFAQPAQGFAQPQPQQGFAQPQQGFAQPAQGFAQPAYDAMATTMAPVMDEPVSTDMGGHVTRAEYAALEEQVTSMLTLMERTTQALASHKTMAKASAESHAAGMTALGERFEASIADISARVEALASAAVASAPAPAPVVATPVPEEVPTAPATPVEAPATTAVVEEASAQVRGRLADAPIGSMVSLLFMGIDDVKVEVVRHQDGGVVLAVNEALVNAMPNAFGPGAPNYGWTEIMQNPQADVVMHVEVEEVKKTKPEEATAQTAPDETAQDGFWAGYTEKLNAATAAKMDALGATAEAAPQSTLADCDIPSNEGGASTLELVEVAKKQHAQVPEFTFEGVEYPRERAKGTAATPVEVHITAVLAEKGYTATAIGRAIGMHRTAVSKIMPAEDDE